MIELVQNWAQGFVDELPTGHHEKPGAIRVVELLRAEVS